MKIPNLLFIFFMLLGSILYAQTKEYTPLQKKETNSPKMMLIEQDSMIVSEIELDEVIVLQKLQFKNKTDLRRYLILKRKTKKVWPYAVLAAERLEKLNTSKASLPTN